MSSVSYMNIEYARTECDSSEEIQYEPNFSKTNPLKHKTELCKTHSELGYCNYGDKCRFAHGKHELVQVTVNQQLRKRRCNGYWGKGICSYGVRCQFGHQEDRTEDKLILQMGKGFVSTGIKQHSRLLRLLQRE